MRCLFYWLISIATAAIPFAAQASETDQVVQEFSGAGSSTTIRFKVQDRWEVRWNARRVVSVAVISGDGTIVAGASGVFRGSLFVPLGGEYYLRVSDGTASSSPSGTHAGSPGSDSSASSLFGSPGETNTPPPAAPSGSTPYGTPVPSPAAPGGSTLFGTPVPPPAEPSAPTSGAESPAPSSGDSTLSWHLQVVQMGTTVASDQALTVITPFFIIPGSVVAPANPSSGPSATDAPPPALTDAQVHAVVTIKGDNAQGTGFLMRSPEGTFVVTQLHLLAANPNVQIYTNSGVPITVRSLKGATDRDLALLGIQDNHFSYLPLPTNGADAFAVGDPVIIPDIGRDAEVPPGVPGKVVATAPQRLDFDNALSPGSSGAPVIHVKSGKVLALVASSGKRIDLSDRIAGAWPGKPAPDSASITSYFGMRLTDVSGWETYDVNRFQAESAFLAKFHHDTRTLDNYLNGKHRSSGGLGTPAVRDNQDFLSNPKIRAAIERYKRDFEGADGDQQLEASRELIYELGNVADADMNTLQRLSSFYAYDQSWAREEIAYRNALKKELDSLQNHPGTMVKIAQP